MQRARRLLAVLVVIPLLVGGLAATRIARAAQTGTGGTVILGLEGDPERNVTTIWPVATSTPVQQLVFDGLVRADASMEFKPDLATRWSLSSDRRTITFYLRKDVKWQDGQAFTSADVAFTYNMMAAPDYNGGQDAYVNFIDGIEDARAGKTTGMRGLKVIDEYTVSFTLKQPFAAVLARMTMGILPKHVLQGIPIPSLGTNDFNFHPIGTGPFKLTEYVHNDHVTLEANPNYFLGRPKIDRIIYRIASPQALLSSWLQGEVQEAEIPISEIPVVQKSKIGTLVTIPSERPTYLGMNTEGFYFGDERVREAVSDAIDRQQIVNVVLGGHGVPISQVHPPQSWAYDQGIPAPKQDLQKAAALLDQAGWKLNANGVREKDGKPFQVELWYVTDREPFQKDLAAIVQAQVARVGLQFNLRAWDSPSIWPTVLPRDGKIVTNGNWQIMVASNSINDGDPEWVRTYLASNQLPPLGINYMYYRDPQMDTLLQEQSTMTNFPLRRNFWYHTIWPYIMEKAPMVALVAPQRFFAVSNKFQGFQPGTNSRVNNVLNWTVQP